MEQIVGTIDNIWTKVVTTRFGDKNVYHAMVNGHDINLGFKHDYVEGESVTLNVETKYGGYQLIKDGGTQSTTAAPGPVPDAPPTAAKVTPPAFPVEKNRKDISIIRQSSLNRAIESVHKLMDSGHFGFNNPQEYFDKVLETAYMYTDFGSGQREVTEAAAIAGYDGSK